MTQKWEVQKKAASASKRSTQEIPLKGELRRPKEEEVRLEESVEDILVDDDPLVKSDSSDKRQSTRRGEAATKAEDDPAESKPSGAVSVKARPQKKSRKVNVEECRFIGHPFTEKEAGSRWPKRYQVNNNQEAVTNSGGEGVLQARRHYGKAEVDGIVYNLNDHAFVQAGEGEENYICRIVEMFEATSGSLHFTARWFYRASDTVIKHLSNLIDGKRVFLSDVHDDNPLECLVQKLSIFRVPLNVDLEAKSKMIPVCDYYYDTHYLLPHSTFKQLPADDVKDGNESSSTISTDEGVMAESSVEANSRETGRKHHKDEIRLLDMYSGCGAMSTGLCLGANLGGFKLVTKWAVDLNEHACNSLKLNHPETEVRNEAAEDFLSLLKEWEKLCVTVGLIDRTNEYQQYGGLFDAEDCQSDDDDEEGDGDKGEVFEVERILAICYGNFGKSKESGLHFKVRWKGYGPDEDTWEPIDGLGNCGKSINEFIKQGYESKLLPLPGDVDVVCGGPPCQGISGFNRFRDKNNPLGDEKNKQLIVFMDIVEYLKPRFVLMENVVDLLKFAEGYLGRYAVGRLVHMNYQTRLGMMAAGAYGLPQFRMRVFVWGAQPNEKLPQYPLPTHNVIARGVIPVEFETHTVAYEGSSSDQLKDKLILADAISDLPAVGTYEQRDEMPYKKEPKTEFQRYIRLTKEALMGSSVGPKPLNQLLYDHRSLELNADDYERVCQIPKRKGANFRDLPGVRVRPDNKVEWDPNIPRVYLKSGKPLVPDYAMSFIGGTSSKPFARLWWDETVATVVTRAEPHNQAILHPKQDRVLSIRENARLQGFPDYYKLTGPVKERYIQVGNAVAVPVARALGYALSQAFQCTSGDDPLMKLPSFFTEKLESPSSTSSDDNAP